MSIPSQPASQLKSWRLLKDHFASIEKTHLRDLFAADPKRGESLVIDQLGLYYDYSKHRISAETMALLLQLAEEAGLTAKRDAMFRGDKINKTEDRAVLHTALRAPKTAKI